MRDSRETSLTKAFVCGHPIKHSRSPKIHNYWLRNFELHGHYEAVDVEPGNFAGFISALKSGESGYVGGNVTIPHKERAFHLADLPDDLAKELGAANTLYMDRGQLCATNTDGYGFLSNLDEQAPGWDDTRNIAVVFGAGGASRAIVQAVRNRGFREIHVLNRTVGRAQELADLFGPRIHAGPIDALVERMAGANLFVNTTSLGMDDSGAFDIDFTPMAESGLVTDIVYVPLMTPFLSQAKQQGRRVADGLGMLLHQAVPGFEKWFGKRPEVTAALRSLIVDDLGSH
ncbi:shikimate dehydrogenase [Rhizobium sp. KVB221]|uniref:Shikimate dehydrogenase (NADP(+)) n=1 Tax=Rhizobium setariae TaxID=2801340 RepID=A0A936YP88_9HYPH|nr:shikimate dehydrogenase [Rhizobium setariae]MBL0374155.1 shikimate dehydrogenase [Rhizobium setariae]